LAVAGVAAAPAVAHGVGTRGAGGPAGGRPQPPAGRGV